MKTRTAASKPRSAGITLTEILISILILGVGLVSLATLFPTVSRAGVNRDDRHDRDSFRKTRSEPAPPRPVRAGFFVWPDPCRSGFPARPTFVAGPFPAPNGARVPGLAASAPGIPTRATRIPSLFSGPVRQRAGFRAEPASSWQVPTR
jgi:Prokaryotic N-terminal methylation motif